MSQPPPYDANLPPANPDKRPLPPGWIEQYDKKFYVNTRENPPRSSWVHPLGPPPPAPPPQSYGPPPGPPPPNTSYAQGSTYGPPSAPQGSYGQAGWSPNQGSGWGQPSPAGWQGYYPGQQSQPYSAPAKTKKSGMGMGTAIAAGGAGLLGGVLLGEAIESHEDFEREEAYQDGYQDGADFDGGDW
ncbi:hypothetical protein K474DRAFT_1683130 [Panus rudis PR-1116 ss-1]|nr:hypothetical protein K474DRAFT_1683130 [Panus rudis PR-1116 ss-1]